MRSEMSQATALLVLVCLIIGTVLVVTADEVFRTPTSCVSLEGTCTPPPLPWSTLVVAGVFLAIGIASFAVGALNLLRCVPRIRKASGQP